MTETQDRLAAAREIKRGIMARGVNMAEWARERGFSPQHVYDVLNGRAVGRRGNAHEIAVQLGLKEVETHKKSPAIAAPGHAPQEGTRMEEHNSSKKFIPTQTPQAREIQKVALWVAAHIGTGMNAEDMLLVRNTLLSLADQVESVELTMMDALHKVMDLAGARVQAEPPAGGAA